MCGVCEVCVHVRRVRVFMSYLVLLNQRFHNKHYLWNQGPKGRLDRKPTSKQVMHQLKHDHT